MPRRYCGCSIHLLVTFACSLDQVRQKDLVVCARFEASEPTSAKTQGSGQRNRAGEIDGGLMLPGQAVSLPSCFFDSNTDDDDAMWVRAEIESAVRQQHAPKVRPRINGLIVRCTEVVVANILNAIAHTELRRLRTQQT
jgi:hypothetical protein